jgi:hypothetical protein
LTDDAVLRYIPQAIRSFVHHFYSAAYGFPFVSYVQSLEIRSKGAIVDKKLEESLKKMMSLAKLSVS